VSQKAFVSQKVLQKCYFLHIFSRRKCEWRIFRYSKY